MDAEPPLFARLAILSSEWLAINFRQLYYVLMFYNTLMEDGLYNIYCFARLLFVNALGKLSALKTKKA